MLGFTDVHSEIEIPIDSITYLGMPCGGGQECETVVGHKQAS
jgi:hypothetical protein